MKQLSKYLLGEFSIKRVVVSLIQIYLILALFAFFCADWMIYHPPSEKYGPLPNEVSLTTSDGIHLSAIFLSNQAKHTILYSHGNAEDLGHDLEYLQALEGAGFNVFAYDYRGYGRSEGKPSEQGLYRDIEAAYRYLTVELKIPSQQILVLGRSLGGGPSTYLASRKSVGGLILESSFTSAFRTVIPFPLFPFDQFQNLKRLSQVHCPLLVIHGASDAVVPVQHGYILYKSFQGPKKCLWVQGADHNDVFEKASNSYFDTLLKFEAILK